MDGIAYECLPHIGQKRGRTWWWSQVIRGQVGPVAQPGWRLVRPGTLQIRDAVSEH